MCNRFDIFVRCRPDLIEFHKLTRSNATHNLQQAFNIAEQHLGLTKLLDPEGGKVPTRGARFKPHLMRKYYYDFNWLGFFFLIMVINMLLCCSALYFAVLQM